MIDLTGKKYGRLTVISFERLEKHKTYWKCACDCGLSVVATGNNLRSGNTKSCGCLRREKAKERGIRNKTHGESHDHRTRLYTIWCGMLQRCGNPNRDAFNLYGGKRITVCEEWSEDYSAFRSWAYENGYRDQEKGISHREALSIDRIDPSKGYCPENCQWITRSENTARANKNHKSRKLIRGEGSQECGSAATHSGKPRPGMNHHEAEAPTTGEKIC